MEKKYINNDEILIMDLIKENSAAINFLYQNYFDSINANVKNNSGQDDDSLDIFQESMVALIGNLKANKFDGQSSLKSYFLAIGRYKWLDELRKRKRKGEEFYDEYPENLHTESIDEYPEVLSERQHKLKANFAKLKPDCQKLLSAFYYQGSTMQEIAKLLDYTIQFVRVKKNRCMNSLKKMIKNG